MKRLVLFFIALLVVLFVGRQVMIPKMAPKVFAKAVSSNIGVDRTADLPDGLHVYICGAGSPLPDAKRSGACMGILAGDKAFIVDVGSGSIRNLVLMGFPLGRVDHFYLTHNHSDHFDGLGEAMLLTWISSGRDTPVAIAGPLGTVKVVDGFNMAYSGDAKNRTAHHGPVVANPAGFGGIGTDIDLTDGTKVIYDDGELKIMAATVTHAPVDPAFGYRIDYKGRSIFISGDTAYDPNIASYAKDVDVLFHEALNREMVGMMEDAARENGAISTATIMADILSYHASPVEAAQTATDANADNLVIYHSIPPMPVDMMKTMWAKGMDKAYDRKITISEDGTIVRLPIDSDVIIYENGL